MVTHDKNLIYQYAKKVYEKKMSRDEALVLIEAKLKKKKLVFSKTSMSYYIEAFCYMLDGRKYTRTISTELRVFYLEKILEEYGVQKLKKALDAFMKHIEYYEGINSTHRKIEREIYDDFSKIVERIEGMFSAVEGKTVV
jgi:5-methylcytosine-specific restriction protein A